MARHKVLPRREQPCFCGHPKKKHTGNYCHQCYTTWLSSSFETYPDPAHDFKGDNFKYIEVLKAYNDTGVISYAV